MGRNSATRASGYPDSQRALRARFEKHPVADLAALRRTLHASKRTVFRALKKAGYHSSYSHAGGHYTLVGIPNFDARGIWFCQDVGFSVHGTLRTTLELLVREAPAGHTHEELQGVLRLRVHDTLRSLVKVGRITRERVQSLYVYVSPLLNTAQVQLARRRALDLPQMRPSAPPLDSARVIDVLLTVIRTPQSSSGKVAADLRKRGLGVTDTQVEDVFARYELGKKTARSRSRRSRR
jgi:hypothetical protein